MGGKTPRGKRDLVTIPCSLNHCKKEHVVTVGGAVVEEVEGEGEQLRNFGRRTSEELGNRSLTLSKLVGRYSKEFGQLL